MLALSIDPSKSFAANDSTKTITPITAAWKSVDGLYTLEEEYNKNVVAFDGKAYQAMISDQSRTPKFYKAIEDRIADGATTVLDLGTGPFAIFAIKAAFVNTDRNNEMNDKSRNDKRCSIGPQKINALGLPVCFPC